MKYREKVKMTRKDVLFLFKGLNNVTTLYGVKFAYAISRNIQKLKPLVQDIYPNIQPPKGFKEYQEKRQDVILKNTNEEGVLNTKNAKKDLKKIDLEYKELLLQAKKQQKIVEKYLAEEILVDLYFIPIEYFPKNISAEKLEPIMAIIE